MNALIAVRSEFYCGREARAAKTGNPCLSDAFYEFCFGGLAPVIQTFQINPGICAVQRDFDTGIG